MKRSAFGIVGCLLTLLVGVALPSTADAQAVTTATVSGRVTGPAGEPLSGVQILVLNQATGTQQGTISRSDGRFLIPALRPGGPYRVEARLIGFGSEAVDGLQLALGQTHQVDFSLAVQAIAIEGVEVTAERGLRRDDGISTTISETAVENAPSVGRDLADLVRFTPQVTVLNESPDGAAISIAGQSNRNNALFIDGVVNSDAFGLAGNGANGGQTGAPPISFDAIDQLQVAISPFDVTQSGFVGGAINVVTRSGTNNLEGSLYYQLRNADLTGKTPGNDDLFQTRDRESVPDFTTQRYGFRLGGPIVQDKLFFFVNGELYRSETPQFLNEAVYEGDLTFAQIGGLRDFLMQEVGYDPGEFQERASSLDDNKLLTKLDWQINDDHRLWLRHSYSGADNIEALTADEDNVYFSNNSEVFPSTTNSSALELTSRFGDRFTNKLLLGMTFVRDDRNISGSPFPQVTIEDASADLRLGSEAFSVGNVLNQDIFTLTNNFTAFLGSHTLTLGTHNEIYGIKNLFLRENYGNYTYRSVADFQRSVCAAGTGQSTYCQQLRAQLGGTITPAQPSRYSRGYSQLTNNLGDDAGEVAAEFDAYQLGLYAQDEFPVGDRLRLTAGVRFELPGFLDDPRGPEDFASTTVPLLDQFGIELDGARPGKAPDPQLIIAPRLGFALDVPELGGAQLRGGVGIFNGRQQFVYPGAMYTNNAVTLGYYSNSRLPNGDPVPFVANPAQAPGVAEFGARRGELDIFTNDFEYPRVVRTSLGVDAALPFGFTGTLEGQYTKTLAGLTVENVNFKPLNARLAGPDNRQVYNYGYDTRFNSFNVNATALDPRYSSILKVGNTDDGYAYDISASLNREFGESLIAHVSYTFGDAYSINDLTSSQIFSIWRFNPNISGLNNLELGRSNYSLGHRILGQVSYTQEFLKNLGTTISAVYTGESGRPYSLLIGNNFGFTGEGSGTSPLAFIPQNAGDLAFADYTVGSGANRVTVTAAEQVAAFEQLLSSEEYLDGRRGDYAERNALRAPFEHVVDLKFAQELFGNFAGRRNSLELTLDVLNFTNLLNKEWGQRYDVGFRTVDLLRFDRFRGQNDLTPVYTYRLRDDEGNLATSLDDYWDDRLLDFGGFGSRWQMQLGVRYSF